MICSLFLSIVFIIRDGEGKLATCFITYLYAGILFFVFVFFFFEERLSAGVAEGKWPNSEYELRKALRACQPALP